MADLQRAILPKFVPNPKGCHVSGHNAAQEGGLDVVNRGEV
jgi:hypothetical protein